MPIPCRRVLSQNVWLLFIMILFPFSAYASPQPLLFEIAPRRARILPHKANSMPWDLGFGISALPDVFVVLEANHQRLQTDIQRNTLRPHWQQKQIFVLFQHSTLQISLYDKDVHRLDLIGKITIPVSQLQKRNRLRFGQVIELILDARLMNQPTPPRTPTAHTAHTAPTIRTPTPTPPTIPPKPRGKPLHPPTLPIPPIRTPSEMPIDPRKQPLSRPTKTPSRPTPPAFPPTPQLHEAPSTLHIHGLLRHRHSQAKIRILPKTQHLALTMPSTLRIYSLEHQKILHQKRSHTFQASNLLSLSHPPRIALGLIGGFLHLPNLQQHEIPHAILLLPLPPLAPPKTNNPPQTTQSPIFSRTSQPTPPPLQRAPQTPQSPSHTRRAQNTRKAFPLLGPFFGSDHNLAYCPTKQRLAWSDAYGQIYLATFPSLSVIKWFKLPHTPHSLAWSPDCALLWSSGLTLSIQPHALPPTAQNTPPTAQNTPPTAQNTPSTAQNTPSTASSTLLSPSAAPAQYAMALLHQKDRLAWCTPQGTVAWRALASSVSSLPPINRSSAFPNAEAPSPCHRLFHHPHAPALLALFSQTIVLFQTHTASADPIQPIQTIDLSADPLIDADLDPQQHLLVTLHKSGKVRRWRWNTQPLK